MSNYVMDVLFDINPENKPNNNKKDKRRVRIFDAIRDHDWMPFHGHVDQFVTTVDEYKDSAGCTPLRGTADLYFSGFWKLMDPREMGLGELRSFLVECMKRLGMLTQPSARGELGNRMVAYATSSRAGHQSSNALQFHIDFYTQAFNDIIGSLPESLDKLALIGSMLREAYYAGRLDFCLLLHQSYNTTLDKITNSDLIPGQHKEAFWRLATQRILGEFFQNKGRDVKSYFAMLEDPLLMDTPAGILLIEHDLVFWAKGNIEKEMRGRVEA